MIKLIRVEEKFTDDRIYLVKGHKTKPLLELTERGEIYSNAARGLRKLRERFRTDRVNIGLDILDQEPLNPIENPEMVNLEQYRNFIRFIDWIEGDEIRELGFYVLETVVPRKNNKKYIMVK